MGLSVTERTADAVYFKCWDEEDHHSLRLRYNPRTGLDLFSFRVEAEDDLGELEQAVERYGCHVTRVSRGEAVGQGESIRFEIRQSFLCGDEIANVGVIRITVAPGLIVEVDGVYTYRRSSDGMIAALRAYWEPDSIRTVEQSAAVSESA